MTLEDDVFCGPSMVFTNVYNPLAVSRKDGTATHWWDRVQHLALTANRLRYQIGHHAFVGAGAVVTSEVKPLP